MFGIFAQSTRTCGIDIKSDCIRFVEIDTNLGVDRITAYGEVGFDGVDPTDENLIQYFKDIKKNLKAKIINVSVPVGSDENRCRELLKSAGIKAANIVNPHVPLAYALIEEELDATFLVIDLEPSQSNYVIKAFSVEPVFYTSDSETHSVISSLNRLYIDWYDKHKEKISHVVFSGKKVLDQNFIDYISKETKFEIIRGDVFTNLRLKEGSVPILNKNDSYKYAIAIGLTIM
jgi:hypothetical protein